jgi:hypothetical protein
MMLRFIAAFEMLRLIAWAAFLVWLGLNYDPKTWVGVEASAYSAIASFYLGFPYAYVFAFAFGTLNFPGLTQHLPIATAAQGFVVWLASTSLLIWLVRRKLRIDQNNPAH